MQVDTKGRLWAAVWHTYPMWEPLKEMKDALVIFTMTTRRQMRPRHGVRPRAKPAGL
jgi:hypothetical protein